MSQNEFFFAYSSESCHLSEYTLKLCGRHFAVHHIKIMLTCKHQKFSCLSARPNNTVCSLLINMMTVPQTIFLLFFNNHCPPPFIFVLIITTYFINLLYHPRVQADKIICFHFPLHQHMNATVFFSILKIYKN